MQDKIQNPYKLQPIPLKELCFDASAQDILDFKFRLARHGSIDGALSTLFFHFMTAMREHLPLATSEELEASNNERFNTMISQLKFPF